jgi:hypothetical protein
VDLNSYAVEMLARDQLAELRRAATRHHVIRTAMPPRRPIRLVVGMALIRLGTLAVGRGQRVVASRA